MVYKDFACTSKIYLAIKNLQGYELLLVDTVSNLLIELADYASD